MDEFFIRPELEQSRRRSPLALSPEALEVLSVKQALQPRSQAETLATFADGSPAVVRRVADKGQVICCGFLPALSYIKPALAAWLEWTPRGSADY